MPEERITLKYRERGRIVWNREVVYQDYDLMGQRAYILAGNENGWLGYLDEKHFTSDFYIMLTSFDLVSVNLYIRYGAEAPKRWSCSGAPFYRCTTDMNGIFPTQADCLSACKGAPCTPNWKCDIPANGYESDGCGNRRANARCNPPPRCGWFISSISVLDKRVSFYIGVDGNSWSIVLKDSSGTVEDIKSGTSYGNHSLTATSYGAHILELNCDWNTTNPCEICSINIPTPSPPTCVPNWKCEVPANGYESDGCGNRRPNTACNPCVPVWECEQPLNGYVNDGCGNRMVNPVCNPPPSCTPSWKCDIPANGYESDGCGNRRQDSICNPPPPPLPPPSGISSTVMLIGVGIGLGVLYYITQKKK